MQPRRDFSPLIYLIVDHVASADQLSRALQDDGYRVRVLRSCELLAACKSANFERPDVVVMDMILPEADTTGAQLLAELNACQLRCPPVVFLSVHDDLPTRLAALRAGACRYLVKPVEMDQLTHILDEITGRLVSLSFRVLMVDDDPVLLEVQAEMLRSAGIVVRTLSQPLQMLEVLHEFDPDVVVLDMGMPDATGTELAAVLRQKDEQLHLPILFLSTQNDMPEDSCALNLGGDALLMKPIQAAQLVSAVTARARWARQSRSIRRKLDATTYEREREHVALNEHAIVSITDKTGAITYVNDKFCETSGYSREELRRKSHSIVKSDEHQAGFYQEMWSTIANGKVWQGEICNRRKDGSLYWVGSTITPFLDETGTPYQYVAIRTDITKQKVAADELRQTKKLLTSIVEHIPAMVFLKRASDLRFELFNRAGENLLGYSRDDLLGKGNYDFWPKQQADWFTAADRKVLESTQVTEITEEPITTASGDVRYLHTWKVALKDEDGDPTHLLGISLDITERRNAEQAAEKFKERLRRGQIFANIGTWDWNIQTGELFWTERISALFGYPDGDLETSYDNFLAAIHPDDRQAVIDAVGACIERDVPYQIEHRVVWPDGTVRWLMERGAVAYDNDGKPLQMLGVVQDIHERKLTELALSVSEKRLQEAQSLARLGHWTADIDSGELFWSEEIYRIFGRNSATFKPSVAAFDAAVHPQDIELVQNSVKLAEQTGVHDVVHRIVRPDGVVRFVHELARAERAADGRLLRLSGTVQDVSEHMQAKEELRQSEERFVFAVEGAGDGIWDWNMGNGEMLLSGFYERMLGYDQGELEPTVDAWIASVHPDDLARVQQNLQDYLAGKIPLYIVELRLRQKDRSYKWVLCRGTVVGRDGENNPSRMIGIHSDITEQKMTLAALSEASESAKSANQAKSEFLSSMSHELRTPMNAILGFGQLIEYDETLPEEHKDNVREILKAGRHLLALINEVLDLSKIESGHIALSLEPVEVGSVVQECLTLVGPHATVRNIKLRQSDFSGATVRVDRTRLRQALLNLLSNAIKYNNPNGSVTVAVQPQGTDRLRILVTDTGLGIPEARLTELFQPFNRLGAEASAIEGSGIGLTITRRIMDVMDGRVGVHSEVGVGSTFWIELPIDSLVETVDEGVDSSTVQPVQRVPTSRHTVLYIEDNPSNIKLVVQLLGRRKHINLLTADSPELGIELAIAHRPQLILLDINMPGMNGYEVLRVFKADADMKLIPVIAVTANAMPSDIIRGKDAGFTDYLTKPLDMMEFYEVIDRVLNEF